MPQREGHTMCMNKRGRLSFPKNAGLNGKLNYSEYGKLDYL